MKRMVRDRGSLLAFARFAVAASIGIAWGCDKDGEDGALEQNICARMDDCNALAAGYNVQDCTDIVLNCTSDLVTSAKQDWDVSVRDCLSLNNCQNFVECYTSIDVCDGGGGSASGGTPAPDTSGATTVPDTSGGEETTGPDTSTTVPETSGGEESTTGPDTSTTSPDTSTTIPDTSGVAP